MESGTSGFLSRLPIALPFNAVGLREITGNFKLGHTKFSQVDQLAGSYVECRLVKSPP